MNQNLTGKKGGFANPQERIVVGGAWLLAEFWEGRGKIWEMENEV